MKIFIFPAIIDAAPCFQTMHTPKYKVSWSLFLSNFTDKRIGFERGGRAISGCRTRIISPCFWPLIYLCIPTLSNVFYNYRHFDVPVKGLADTELRWLSSTLDIFCGSLSNTLVPVEERSHVTISTWVFHKIIVSSTAFNSALQMLGCTLSTIYREPIIESCDCSLPDLD